MAGLGTILNAIGILVGGLVGLCSNRQVSAVNQSILRVGMGAFTVYAGLAMTWQAVGGTFLQVLKQLALTVLSMILGKLIGRLLRIQKLLNHLGQQARLKYEAIKPGIPARFGDGFTACTILYCVSPMTVLGACADGLSGNFKVLAVKALMDGLATLTFARVFGWSALVSVVPVIAFQGTLTIVAAAVSPWLTDHRLLDPVQATAGLLVFSLALIMLELKKVEVGDYLPSLAVAPVLAWLW